MRLPASARSALLLVVLLAAACAEEGEHGEYEVHDEPRAAPRPDYSRYFSPAGSASQGASQGPAAATAAAAAAPASHGFVEPIDFSTLLANSRLGEGGEAVAASASRVRDFFRAAGSASGLPSFAIPSLSAFAAEPQESATENNNTAGFTSPAVRFQSLFDASNPSGEVGFRPQDFLQPGQPTAAAAENPSRSSSPSFSKLEHDYRPSYLAESKNQQTHTLDRDYRPSYLSEIKNKESQSIPQHYQSYVPSYPVVEPHTGKSSYQAPPSLDKPANPEYYRAHAPVPAETAPEAETESKAHAPSPSPPPKDKKCKKIDKTISTEDLVKGRFRRDAAAAMTCYVCEDPKTGGNYEECSYATEPKSKKFFVGHAQSYSTDKNVKPTTYRYRREVDQFDMHIDPYTSADGSYGFPYALDTKGDYRYSSQDFVPSSVDYTAAPSNKNCKKVQKDNMTCYVCKDPKGGSYEQCSYAQEPKSNNYFVARESSYNTGNKAPYLERYRRDNKYEATPEQKQSATETRTPGRGLDPFLYGEIKPFNAKDDKVTSASEKVDNFYAPYRSYEDYFRHLFPELEPREASASSPEVSNAPQAPGFEYQVAVPDYFTNNDKKKDLDAVLGEFTQKDRSDCKKVQKEKMTCYQCIDKKGMQHEECMFVAASEPKSQHLAYHEVKEFNLAPKAGAAAEGSSNVPVTTSNASSGATSTEGDVGKAKRGVKADIRADLRADDMAAAASEQQQQRKEAPSRRAPEPAAPQLSELDRSPDGLYSAETRHRFDPVLKVTLPEYMLTRSEHEAIFDEVMASGR